MAKKNENTLPKAPKHAGVDPLTKGKTFYGEKTSAGNEAPVTQAQLEKEEIAKNGTTKDSKKGSTDEAKTSSR